MLVSAWWRMRSDCEGADCLFILLKYAGHSKWPRAMVYGLLRRVATCVGVTSPRQLMAEFTEPLVLGAWTRTCMMCVLCGGGVRTGM